MQGKYILDLGCGEDGYSRALAQKGAIVTSADCSEVTIEHSKSKANTQIYKSSMQTLVYRDIQKALNEIVSFKQN